MPFCPNCGHKVDVTARFCENCGAALNIPRIPPPTPPVVERKVRRTRAPKITFILGLITLILGIVLVFAIPASVTWEPKSKVIADQETLTASAGWKTKSEIIADQKPLAVSAGWASKSGVLADKESLSTSPLWQSKNKSDDEVLTVYAWESYDYSSFSSPWIYGEAKNFVISGNAVEQSSPQHSFNFYVFDSVNFDLWKADVAYTAYYEAKGKTSFSFSFSIADQGNVPSWFYFVVEEYAIGVKPVVRVTATINWVEKSAIYAYTKYYLSYGLSFYEDTKDFVVEGTAKEDENHNFNFYIIDSSNYDSWYNGKAYTSYYEVKDKSTINFSVSLTKDQATSSIYFIVENPNLDIYETVKLSATIRWIGKASISDRSAYFTSYGTSIEESKDVMLNGTASAANNKFNFYVFDSDNYWNWREAKAYMAYFEEKNVTLTSFYILLSKEQATSAIYFVAENPLLNVNETVKVSATLEYEEKAPLHDCSGYFTSSEYVYEKSKDFVLRGTATEAGNNKFNFYVFDGDNYDNWADGKSYTSYYEVKNVTTTSFSIPLTEKQAESTTYFVVENPLLDISETVKVSATLEYKEKATIAATIVGFVFGSFIAFIGFIIMIIAGIMAFIFRRQ